MNDHDATAHELQPTGQPFPCRGAQAGFIAGYFAGLRNRRQVTPDAIAHIERHAQTAARTLFYSDPVNLAAAAAMFQFFDTAFDSYSAALRPDVGHKQPADPKAKPEQL